MQDYWGALERLKKGVPVRLPKGTLINKDTVALEAGRKRGSIKKSRNSFSALIAAIDSAAQVMTAAPVAPKDILRRAKAEKHNYRELYHQALNRELMLIERLAQLEKELRCFSNVVPIRD